MKFPTIISTILSILTKIPTLWNEYQQSNDSDRATYASTALMLCGAISVMVMFGTVYYMSEQTEHLMEMHAPAIAKYTETSAELEKVKRRNMVLQRKIFECENKQPTECSLPELSVGSGYHDDFVYGAHY